MNTLIEIEFAIERLTIAEVAELAAWINQYRTRHASQSPDEAWLRRARGAARSGVTTEGVLALTRGEE